MAPLDPPSGHPAADNGFGKLSDERNNIRRMVAEDRAENGEPAWAEVHSTPSGRRFYGYCRDPRHTIPGTFTTKAAAEVAVQVHNALHA